jgi:hypothetical protein
MPSGVNLLRLWRVAVAQDRADALVLIQVVALFDDLHRGALLNRPRGEDLAQIDLLHLRAVVWTGAAESGADRAAVSPMPTTP